MIGLIRVLTAWLGCFETVTSFSIVTKPFGRQEYWEGRYETSPDDFSWYSDWTDLEPFVTEFCAECCLVLGVGTDAGLLRGLLASKTTVAAFDYAQSSIHYLQQQPDIGPNVRLEVADARDLQNVFQDDEFDMVLDKGSLDAIFIAGDTDMAKEENIRLALREANRVLAKGGIFWSLSGICTDSLVSILEQENLAWDIQVKTTDGIFTTSSGFTSNNLDGHLILCSKR